jgi:hypothetical protein
LHSVALGFELKLPVAAGVQVDPFQVWVMVEAVFQTEFAGSPVHATFVFVLDTHAEFSQW